MENSQAKLPLRFEANKGQTDSEVKFVSRGSRHSFFLTPNEAVLSIGGPTEDGITAKNDVLRMRLEGASRDPQIDGQQRLPGMSNYLFGKDPRQWVTGVPSYAKVRYRSVYPGVDLLYYGNDQGQLEYDFAVAPGIDPSSIKLAFDGARSLTLDMNGDLLISAGSTQIRQLKPSLYQEEGGARRPVPGSYLIEGDNVRFKIGDYDPSRELVIDPVLTYSTFLGGSGNDEASGIATDVAGNAYLAGSTTSVDFPMGSDPADHSCGDDGKCDPKGEPAVLKPDAFISKISSDGSRLEYSTYIGGAGDDRATDIAVWTDPSGQTYPYITGRTDSANFPISDNAFDKKCGSDGFCDLRPDSSNDPRNTVTKDDGFLTKLSSDGSAIAYSTYLGGSGDDVGRAGAGWYRATVVAPNEPLEAMPERHTGASNGDPMNGPHPGPAAAVAVDSTGAAYVTGVTLSADFLPVTKSQSLPEDQRPFRPHDGTCGSDNICNRSTFRIVTAAGTRDFVRFQPDVFLVKLDPTRAGDGSNIYATYLGGGGGEVGHDIAVATVATAPAPDVYLTGFTYSPAADSPSTPEADNFPTTAHALQPVKPLAYNETATSAIGDWNQSRARSVPFVTRLNVSSPNGQLHYSTFLGGRQPNKEMTWNGGTFIPDSGHSIAADPDGHAYVTGVTDAFDFPTSNPAFQAQKSDMVRQNATSDAFVAKLDTNRAGLDSRVFATYLGGIDQESGLALAIDSLNQVHLTGRTASTVPIKGSARAGLFPLKNPIQDFPSQVSDECSGFANGSSPPEAEGARCRDAFVTVLDSSGSSLVYSTFIRGDRHHPEGSTEDVGRAVTTWTEPSTQVVYSLVAGRTGTFDFPTVSALQRETGGYIDSFLIKIAPINPPSPYITAVEPKSGVSSGGTVVTITGSGFGATKLVEFDRVRAELLAVNETQITVLGPPGSGNVEIKVTTPLGSSPSSSMGTFSYFEGTLENAPPNRKARYGHSATLLDSGKVLLVGGRTPTTCSPTPCSGTVNDASADLYDASSGLSTDSSCVPGPGSTCPVRGFGHTATRLRDGTVLVAGGIGSPQSAQIYDPKDGKWRDVGNLLRSRFGQTATLLEGPNCGDNCGKVLVVGGIGTPFSDINNSGVRPNTGPAELYDPTSKAWVATAAPVDIRGAWHTATSLNGPQCAGDPAPAWCGKVLVVGGASRTTADPESSSSAELYDPKLGVWTERRTDLVARYGHSATMLSSGKVLLTGGILGFGLTTHTSGTALAATEVFDPSKPFGEAFTLSGQLLTARSGHAAVPLPDGRALIVGGAADVRDAKRAPLASAEIWDPNLGARGEGGWSDAGTRDPARGNGPWPAGHTATVLGGCGADCGKVLVFGGTTSSGRDLPSGGSAGPEPSEVHNSVVLYTAGPHITEITPPEGEAGTEVTIKGSGFVAGRTTVAFDGRPAEIVSIGSNVMKVRSPPAVERTAVDVTAVVEGLGLARAPQKFTYTGLPGKVTDLVATAVSSDQVKLGFSAPGLVEDAGDPATDYVIKQSRTPLDAANFDTAASLCEGGVCKFSPTRRGLGLTLSVDGLTPETTYYYAVRAKNGVGRFGPMSNVADVVTGTVAPGAVTDLVANSLGEGKVELTFSAPGSNGIAPPPATRYVVRQSLDPIGDEGFEAAPALCGGICTLAPAAVGDRLSISVDNLARNTTYHYRLQALDAAGNAGPLSNPASATPSCVAATAGHNQVSYPSGYSLVGLPEGTVVPAQSSLYGWFDSGKGGRYSTQDPSHAVLGGRGYWAWFSCSRVVNLPGAGVSSAGSSLGAYRASMVGNPSATREAKVSGHDFAARWDGSLNAGAGGYRISAYQQPQLLEVGEGIWAFSYRDAFIAIDAL